MVDLAEAAGTGFTLGMVDRTVLPLEVRRIGFLTGAVIGAALAARTSDVTDPAEVASRLALGPLAPPAGRRSAGVALGDGLIEELLAGGVDLERLAGRWLTWWRDDGLDADPVLIEALAHLDQFHAPIDQLDGSNVAALGATLPAALAAGSMRAMVSGTFHTSRLLDPSAETGWAAVAVVVAAARFLAGQRDFLADVLTLLRVNQAPSSLIDSFAAIAREPRRVPPPPRGATPAADVAVWLLWHAEQRPRSGEALGQMMALGGISPVVGALLGGLLGARDGVDAWPAEWAAASGEDVVLRRAVASRLGPTHEPG